MDPDLRAALMDIVGILNSPRYDDILLAEAGTELDRALFPLLARIEILGPIRVVDLAEHAGRDHSTVSRQVARLQALGLVTRRTDAADRRARAIEITAEGRRVAARIAVARDRLMDRMLGNWTAQDRTALARLNRRLADSMKAQRGSG